MTDDNLNDEQQQQLLHHGLHNLDPAVAALLEPLDTTTTTGVVTKQEMHTRIAHLRLKQEHVRGTATYAAKIIDQACQDARQDRQIHELLAAQVQRLERAAARLDEDSAVPQKKNDSDKTKTNQEDASKDSSQKKEDKTDSSSTQSTTDDEQTRRRIHELEDLLRDRLESEIQHCKADQTALRQQEQRLRDRIQSLHQAVQEQRTKLSPNHTRRLEEALADLNEYTTAIHSGAAVDCIVCSDRPAVRAVIPCGHLCLCDACTPALVEAHATLSSSSSSSSPPCCPLCRGSLLSTLKIYCTAEAPSAEVDR